MTIIREGRSGEDVKRLSTLFGLTPRTTCDKELVEAIKKYQKSRGLVDDGIFGYKSWKTLLIEERYSNNQSGRVVDSDYQLFGWLLDCEPEMLKAFVSVESSGSGFLPSHRPVILFESYQFFKNLKSIGIDPYQYMKQYPDIITDKWIRNYQGGEKEWVRLEKAEQIHKDAALSSASWGLLQIMGSNYKLTGEKNVQDFVIKMSKDEFTQLSLGIEFIKSQGIVPLMISKDFNGMARIYNGPGYAKNGYGLKLKTEYYRLKRQK
jgi:hypothetical protein